MKNYLFSKLLLLGILLAISYGEAVAYKATTTADRATSGQQVFMGSGNWGGNNDYLYTGSEMLDQFPELWTTGVTIRSIGFRMGRRNIDKPRDNTTTPPTPAVPGGDVPRNTTLRIYMAVVNVNDGALQRNVPADDPSWTLVFEWHNFNFTKYREAVYGVSGGYEANDWATLKFNTLQAENGFSFPSQSGLRIKICMDRDVRVGPRDTLTMDNSVPQTNASNCFVYCAPSIQTHYGNFLTTGASHDPDICNSEVNNGTSYNRRPQLQFDFELPSNQYIISEGGATPAFVFHPMSSNHRFQFVPQTEYYNNTGKAGLIKSLSLRLANVLGTGINEADRKVRIYMAAAPEWAQSLQDLGSTHPYDFDGWQLVYERDNPTLAKIRAENGLTGVYNYGDWVEFPFDNDFEYTSGAIMYYFCSSGSTGAELGGVGGVEYNNGTQFYAKETTFSSAFESYGTGISDCQSLPTQPPGGSGFIQQQLDVRFRVSPLPENNAKYESVSTIHPSLESTVPAAQNVQVLRHHFRINGQDRQATLQNLTFLNKSLDGYVTAAKVWYTSGVAGLNTGASTPIATIDLSNTTEKTISVPLSAQMSQGNHYFWLTFDIAPGVEFIPAAIDASLTNFAVKDGALWGGQTANFGNSGGTIFNPDPEGAIDVSDYLAVYCPPGVNTPQQTALPQTSRHSGPFSGYHNLSRSRNVYTYDELNNGTPGVIGEMAVYAWSGWASGGSTHDSVYIFMKNLPKNSGAQNTPPAVFQQENDFGSVVDMGWAQLVDKYRTSGYTQVAGPFALPYVDNSVSRSWINFPFTNKFQYLGGDLEVIVHRISMDNFDGNNGYNCDNIRMNGWEEARYADNGQQFWSYGILQTDGGTLACNQLINSVNTEMIPQNGAAYSDYNKAPKSNARFSVQYIEGSQYRASNAFQTSKPYMTNGTQADEVLGVMIETEGMDTDPYEQLRQMTFDGKASHNAATHAMLYYSGLDSTWGTATQIGEDVALTASNISNIQFSFEQDEFKLKNGKNYFWLAYRISNNANNIGKEVDAQFISGRLEKWNEKVGGFYGTELDRTLTMKDPDGVKTIVGVLPKNTYYVGRSASIATDYETLADFADAYSQYGINGYTDVIIVSDITDSRVATFNYNPYRGDVGSDVTHRLFLRIEPTATEGYTLTATQNGGSVIELLPGYRNFSLFGRNDNQAQLTIEKSGTGGNAITGTQVSGIAIWNTNIIGSTNGVSIEKAVGVTVSGNTITRASNYAVLLDTASGIISVADNNIGSAAANVRNGLALIGCESPAVTNNRFVNITSTNTDNNRAILVSNIAAGSITKIHNNAINDVKSNGNFASAIEISNNNGNVDIMHNTVIFSADRGRQIYSSIFNLGTMAPNATLNVTNNLFINNIAPAIGLYSQQYYDPLGLTTHMTNFEDKGNVYSGGQFMHLATGTIYDFATWKNERRTNVGTETALTSNYINVPGNFTNVDSMDFHTDGPICNASALFVDVVNRDLQDVDGVYRGQFILNKTMAGADEFFPIARNDESSNSLPAAIEMCENSYESIILRIDRRFEKWSDGVTTRKYIPQVTNYWITDKGDTLKSDNGIDLTRYPYLYIERPNYTHTMKLKCVSTFWTEEFETDWCDISVIRAPYIRDIPNATACWTTFGVNAGGVVEIDATDYIEGSAESFQWQKKTGTTWANVPNETTPTLSYTFANNQDEVRSIVGTYRLQVTPYDACNDNTGASLYSNEIDVSIGIALSINFIHTYAFSDGTTNAGDRATTKSFCSNDEAWFAVTLALRNPANPNADFVSVTRYQWEKRSYPTSVWIPIETATNPTATSDTLRFSSLRSEDAGVYRCVLYGYDCTANDRITAAAITVNVIPASEILTQPAPVTLSCVGRTLTDEISVSITDPPNSMRIYNKYQWFKDGKEFKRLDASGNEITPSHPLYATHRTDTTYLPFARLTTGDGGKYILRTIYLNCEQQADTVFSDTARLYAYNPAMFRSQSDSMYVSLSGYATLEMDMLTDMANNSENLGVTYLWYRQRTMKTPTGNITRIDTLRNSPKFSVMAGQLRINNITVMDVNQVDSTTLSDNYYCVVTDYCTGAKLTSKPMKLKLAPEITIVKSPDSSIVCEGENVTMVATATSADNNMELIYEWYKVVGGAPVILPGENDTTLVLSAVNADDATDYYCVVSLKDLAGANKRTNVANLIINPKPIISNIDYPTGGVVTENSPFTLTAVVESMATGTYQWYFNGAPISGATSVDYTVTAATKANEGTYYVIATNDCGETQSTPVEIKISVGIATTNDDPTFHIVSVSPNPVANDATVKFVVPTANTATLTLLDLNGRQVVDLYSGSASEGTNTVLLSNKLNNVSSGTYFIILESQGRKASVKITISKQ